MKNKDELVEYACELLDHGEIEWTHEAVYQAIIAAGHDEDVAVGVADEVAAYHEWE